MDTLIPAFLRHQRNQRRLTLEMLSAKVDMSPQHLSEIESGKRDPRLSSIERMAEAMGMTVLIVPDAMAPDLRRYVANNGRIHTTHAGQAARTPNTNMDGRCISENELTKRWQVSESTLERWCPERIGPSFLKLGGQMRYRLMDILTFEGQTHLGVSPGYLLKY